MPTVAERERRGYDLSEEDRVIANVEFLKGKFLRKSFQGTIIGGISKMALEYQMLAVDNLTGRINWPEEIRKEQYGRVITDKDVTVLTYRYSVPMPGLIDLPRGYDVLPVEILISMSDLSAEAIRVIQETKRTLFNPIIDKIDEALRKTTDRHVMRELAKIQQKLRKAA